MGKSPMHPRRRRFIKLTATGLVAAPFANALLRGNAAALALRSRTSLSLRKAGAPPGEANNPVRKGDSTDGGEWGDQ